MLQGSSKEVGGVDMYTLASFEVVLMVLVGRIMIVLVVGRFGRVGGLQHACMHVAVGG